MFLLEKQGCWGESAEVEAAKLPCTIYVPKVYVHLLLFQVHSIGIEQML